MGGAIHTSRTKMAPSCVGGNIGWCVCFPFTCCATPAICPTLAPNTAALCRKWIRLGAQPTWRTFLYMPRQIRAPLLFHSSSDADDLFTLYPVALNLVQRFVLSNLCSIAAPAVQQARGFVRVNSESELPRVPQKNRFAVPSADSKGDWEREAVLE